jgi:hypothetical protein
MAGAGSQSVYGQYDAASGGYTAIAGPQINSYQVIGTVTSGPPIITDPKTGKPYPPNYVPDEQAPGTHEMWTPGSSYAEGKKLQVARLQEFTRAAIESAVRPHEEKLVDALEKGVDKYGQAVAKIGAEFGKDPGKAISNVLGGIGSSATKNAGQTMQAGQQLAGQAMRTGQQLAGQASASFGGGGSSSQASLPRVGGGQMTSVQTSQKPDRSPLMGVTGSSIRRN